MYPLYVLELDLKLLKLHHAIELIPYDVVEHALEKNNIEQWKTWMFQFSKPRLDSLTINSRSSMLNSNRMYLSWLRQKRKRQLAQKQFMEASFFVNYLCIYINVTNDLNLILREIHFQIPYSLQITLSKDIQFKWIIPWFPKTRSIYLTYSYSQHEIS